MYFSGTFAFLMRTFVLSGVTLALLACSAEPEQVVCPGGTCDPLRDAGGDQNVNDLPSAGDVTNDRNANDTGPRPALVSLRVEPAMATLVTRDGTPAMQDFSVTGVLADGRTVNVNNATWSAAPMNSPAGAIGMESGRFTATGAAGARFTVTVSVASTSGDGPLTATAILDVRTEREVTAMGTAPVSAEESMRFAMAPRVNDAMRAPTIVYPLDRAVMPANVPPPDVQWQNGAENDLYAVRLTKPHASLRAWVRHSGMMFRYDWLVDTDGWRALLESDPEAPVAIAVDRFEAARNEVIQSAPVNVTIARATLSGTIYYWDLSEGRIMKLDAITAARSPAIPSPPPKPDDPDRGSRCVACHTISRDGRYMSAELWGGDRSSTVFDLSSAMINSDPAPTLFTPATPYLFSTFSPDSRLLVTNRGNTLRLMNRDTGTYIDTAGLPATGAAHPDWSPDGMHLAYVANVNGGWAVDFSAGDLAVADRTSEMMFAPGRILHHGVSTPERPVVAHPSFTPDSRWVAFQHGTNSRGANSEDRANPNGYPGRLEMVSASATPDQPALVLARANGDTVDSYWPNFSPFNGGGYFWLAFYSRRDYGNAQAGTRGTRRRQIWVTAVSNNPSAGSDPSSVPYWLPGQETRVDNMSAFWAPVACRMNMETCSVSSECCSGVCQRGADGMFRCDTPAMQECRRAGRTCSSNADCCDGLVCFANVCGAPPG